MELYYIESEASALAGSKAVERSGSEEVSKKGR